MKNIHTAVIAGAVILTSFNTVAKNYGDENLFAVAKRQAPDVIGWEKTAEGFYEGVGKAGEHVRIFVGPGGAKLDLAQERLQLRMLEERRINPTLNVREVAEIDHATLISLERITHLQRVVSSHSSSSAKAFQSQYTFGTVCGEVTIGETTFKSDTGFSTDTPHVTASLETFGGGTFGPPAPTFPVVVYREVGAGFGVLSPTESIDYVNSYAVTGTIMAETGDLTFPGNCFFRTLQGVAAQCSTGGPYEYYTLIRDQTCTGVHNNLPPTES